MSEILIKGLEMPEHGKMINIDLACCRAFVIKNGHAVGSYNAEEIDPHGRLIDADEFMKVLIRNVKKTGKKPLSRENAQMLLKGVMFELENEAPTIVEASNE